MFKFRDAQVMTISIFGITTPLIHGIDVLSSLFITVLTGTYLILKIRHQWKQNKKD